MSKDKSQFAGSLDKLTLPEVVVKKNSGSDLLQVISAYAYEKLIRLPKGDFDIGAEIIELTLPANETVKMAGHGRDTRIIGSATNIIRVMNTAYNDGIVDISDMQFRHSCPHTDDSDITLDLCNSIPYLRNVSCRQLVGWRGLAFKNGERDTPSAPSGIPATWIDTMCSQYKRGYHLGHQHLSCFNPIANNCQDEMFRLENTRNHLVGVFYVSLFYPHTFISHQEEADVYNFRVNNPLTAITFVMPWVENKPDITLTKPIFSRIDPTLGSAVTILGFSATNPQFFGGGLRDSGTIFPIVNWTAKARTCKQGSVTLSGDGVTTDFEIGAHELFMTLASQVHVQVTPASTASRNAMPAWGYRDPADATKIRVKFANPPASGTNNVVINYIAIAM